MKRILLAVVLAFAGHQLSAQTFNFSTGNPDGQMAIASRTGPGFEIEAADDFVLSLPTAITGGSFTGLLPSNFNLGNIAQVTVEIYRVFPLDSEVGRTSGPPIFSTPQVPTRINSPSDVAFASRSSAPSDGLNFSTSLLAPDFTAFNSVQPGGIHPFPNQTTGGNGPVNGEEVQFNFTLTAPLDLPADHYFFVPQVQLLDGTFLWLSAPRPIVPPGTTFNPDLQAWTRDANLDPDWLRVGTDIVGGVNPPTFNAAFSLTGNLSVPDSGSTLLLFGLAAAFLCYRRPRYRSA